MNIKDHFNNVASLGCVVSARQDVTLHHCHSGSMNEIVRRGASQKTSDWLVIPLHADFHIGRWGCDGAIGILTWEQKFGRQVDFLIEVRDRLGYDIFKLAGITQEIKNVA